MALIHNFDEPVAVVTGSRDWTNRYKIYDVLHTINPSIVLQGGAAGADRIALEWCSDSGKTCVTVPALWEFYGKAAGGIRNSEMLRVAEAIAVHNLKNLLVLAFPLPQSIGTYSCIKIAKSMEMRVFKFDDTMPSVDGLDYTEL